MQEGNKLEADIVCGVLQIRLSITEYPKKKNTYLGEIKSLFEYQKLRALCSSLEDVLEYISDSSNVRLDLSEMSVALLSPFGKRIEVAKIMLKKEEESRFVDPLLLDNMINRCSERVQLDNDEVKKNFEILATEILCLKDLFKKNKEES